MITGVDPMLGREWPRILITLILYSGEMWSMTSSLEHNKLPFDTYNKVWDIRLIFSTIFRSDGLRADSITLSA